MRRSRRPGGWWMRCWLVRARTRRAGQWTLCGHVGLWISSSGFRSFPGRRRVAIQGRKPQEKRWCRVPHLSDGRPRTCDLLLRLERTRAPCQRGSWGGSWEEAQTDRFHALRPRGRAVDAGERIGRVPPRRGARSARRAMPPSIAAASSEFAASTRADVLWAAMRPLSPVDASFLTIPASIPVHGLAVNITVTS